MNYLDRITVEPDKCGGRPCVRGLRIRVKDVLELLAHGAAWAEILGIIPISKLTILARVWSLPPRERIMPR
ncbi:MAG TPA: DUF433 domain-containing protein [Chthoniobacterales bacterium]|jgi:uncharacterized protein (DUF433 family)